MECWTQCETTLSNTIPLDCHGTLKSDNLSSYYVSLLMDVLIQGIAVAQYKPASGSAGGPPPPPPPPSAPAPSTGKAPAGGAGAVFAELNKGEAVTQGLRKVDKSEMTHKNPSLRAGSAVPDRSTSPARTCLI